jgi:hypothetical protein
MSIAPKFISTMPILLHSVLGDLGTIPSEESEDSEEEEK